MEETSGAVADASLKEPPFSELISVWLDEGERLSASAAAAPASRPGPESRLRHVVQRLRPVIERHRLFVLVGIGLLPLALILSAHRGAPVPAAPASTIAAAPPVAASPRVQSPRSVQRPSAERAGPGGARQRRVPPRKAGAAPAPSSPPSPRRERAEQDRRFSGARHASLNAVPGAGTVLTSPACALRPIAGAIRASDRRRDRASLAAGASPRGRGAG